MLADNDGNDYNDDTDTNRARKEVVEASQGTGNS